jgi:hypothetical protein
MVSKVEIMHIMRIYKNSCLWFINPKYANLAIYCISIPHILSCAILMNLQCSYLLWYLLPFSKLHLFNSFDICYGDVLWNVGVWSPLMDRKWKIRPWGMLSSIILIGMFMTSLGYLVLYLSTYFVCACFFVELYLHDWCLLRNLYTWEWLLL